MSAEATYCTSTWIRYKNGSNEVNIKVRAIWNERDKKWSVPTVDMISPEGDYVDVEGMTRADLDAVMNAASNALKEWHAIYYPEPKT